MAEAAAAGRAAVRRTGVAVRLALGRPDGRLVFAATTVAYLAAYLYAIGHLAPGEGGLGVLVVPDAAGRFLRPSLGPFAFEPVAVVRAGPVTYLLSLNTLLGLGLAALVGLNLAVTALAWRQPAACGLGSRSAGALAGLPALLSGAACCGPFVLLVLGIQATGVLLTAFDWLLPAAAALLVASLLLVGRQVRPEAASPAIAGGA